MAIPIPFDSYSELNDSFCAERIRIARKKLGTELIILAHHYQRESVFHHADFSGDSLRLSRLAATAQARYIVFCGVHFMAEVADILSREEQVVLLPDLAAGCSMADMANLITVERAWNELIDLFNGEQCFTPVTYINSSAELKAFCGRNGGIVCTSSNARSILEWSLRRREKILFFPDQHLGRNTGFAMGIPLSEMALWDADLPYGGIDPEMIRRARIILWNGFCSVHQIFQPEHIDQLRQQLPDAKVIVHPECSLEVCQKADIIGSTESIIKAIHDSPPGSNWIVGTEFNLVQRLAERERLQSKTVHFLAPFVCKCSMMMRISPQHLAWTLDNLVAGELVNRIQVPFSIAESARRALRLMLEVSP